MRGLLSLVNEEEAGTDSLQEVISKQNKHFHSLPIFFSFQLILSLFYVAGRWRPSHWGRAFGDQVGTRNSLDRVFLISSLIVYLSLIDLSLCVVGGGETWLEWRDSGWWRHQLNWEKLQNIVNSSWFDFCCLKLTTTGQRWLHESLKRVYCYDFRTEDFEVRTWSRSIQ